MRVSSVIFTVSLALAGCGDGSGSGGTGGTSGSGGSGGSDTSPLLPAPPPDQGVQLNVPAITVMPGEERQVCIFLKLPSDTDFFFDHIQMEMTDGGRHLHLFKSEFFDFPDEFRQDCFAPLDTNTWALVVNSQNKSLDWTVEPTGTAFRLRNRTQLMIQAHYYNGTSQPVTNARATINLWRRDASQVTDWVGTIPAVQNQISVPPHAMGYQVTLHCTLPIDTPEQTYKIHPTHILALSGDFHHAGRDFNVENFVLSSTAGCPPTCPGTQGPPQYYDTTNGLSPLWEVFTPGSEPVMQNNDGFYFTCTYDNPSAETLTFGPKLMTQEHCSLYIYFYPAPKDGLTLGCTEITGAW